MTSSSTSPDASSGISSGTSSGPAVPPAPAERADASSGGADRVSRLRVAAWAVIALVLATGIILYFRHRGDVAPVLGVESAGSGASVAAGIR